MFVLTGSDSPQTVSMLGWGSILFSLSVFCEWSWAPKLDASDWFYWGLSSPLGIVADVRPCNPCPARMRRCFWRIRFLSLFKLHHSFGWEATAAVSVLSPKWISRIWSSHQEIFFPSHEMSMQTLPLVLLPLIIPHLSFLSLKCSFWDGSDWWSGQQNGREETSTQLSKHCDYKLLQTTTITKQQFRHMHKSLCLGCMIEVRAQWILGCLMWDSWGGRIDKHKEQNARWKQEKQENRDREATRYRSKRWEVEQISRESGVLSCGQSIRRTTREVGC